MRYALVIVLLLCSLHSDAEPFENWTTTEKELFITAELALLADYKTTSSVLYPSRGYAELNPFIGPQPGHDRLTAWFVGWMIGHYFIADYLGHADRKNWLLVLTITESAAAAHNMSIGGQIRF